MAATTIAMPEMIITRSPYFAPRLPPIGEAAESEIGRAMVHKEVAA